MNKLVKLIFLFGIVILQSCGSSLRLSSGNLPVLETDTYSKKSGKTVKTKEHTIAEKKTVKSTGELPKNPVKPVAKEVEVKNTSKPEPASQATSIPLTRKTNDAASAKASMIISNAQTYLHTPYRMGGTSYSGIDCSALIMQSFKTQGINLPRTADAQANVGKAIALSEVQPGDLLFFYSSQPGVVGHSGLVVSVENGTITFIHAALSGVRYDNMNNPHWKKHYLSARRVIQ